jgi:hypothetical protein
VGNDPSRDGHVVVIDSGFTCACCSQLGSWKQNCKRTNTPTCSRLCYWRLHSAQIHVECYTDSACVDIDECCCTVSLPQRCISSHRCRFAMIHKRVRAHSQWYSKKSTEEVLWITTRAHATVKSQYAYGIKNVRSPIIRSTVPWCRFRPATSNKF